MNDIPVATIKAIPQPSKLKTDKSKTVIKKPQLFTKLPRSS